MICVRVFLRIIDLRPCLNLSFQEGFAFPVSVDARKGLKVGPGNSGVVSLVFFVFGSRKLAVGGLVTAGLRVRPV